MLLMASSGSIVKSPQVQLVLSLPAALAGKEKLFLEAARAVGKKVFVPALKRRTMECLGLSVEEMDLVTTDPGSTNLHAVPLWALASFKRIQQTVSHYEVRRGRRQARCCAFLRILGHEPHQPLFCGFHICHVFARCGAAHIVRLVAVLHDGHYPLSHVSRLLFARTIASGSFLPSYSLLLITIPPVIINTFLPLPCLPLSHSRFHLFPPPPSLPPSLPPFPPLITILSPLSDPLLHHHRHLPHRPCV